MKKNNQEIEKFIDQYIFGKYQRMLKSKISSLKRHDERVRTLVDLYETGLIDKDYYDHIAQESKKKVKFGEQQVEELFGRFNRWMIMTQEEKIKFVKMNINRVEIDIINKTVKQVFFK